MFRTAVLLLCCLSVVLAANPEAAAKQDYVFAHVVSDLATYNPSVPEFLEVSTKLREIPAGGPFYPAMRFAAPPGPPAGESSGSAAAGAGALAAYSQFGFPYSSAPPIPPPMPTYLPPPPYVPVA